MRRRRRIENQDSDAFKGDDDRRFIYGFENRIYIADVNAKKPREIDFPLPTEEIKSVGISHDGRLIYYTIFSSESDIWLLDHSAIEQR